LKGGDHLKSAVNKIPEKISELLGHHTKDLEEAWANVGSGEALNISFSAKIGFDKQGKPACEVGIAFIKERVKDSVIFNWDDHQANLFELKKGPTEEVRKVEQDAVSK
jgi:hypothetical protein